MLKLKLILLIVIFCPQQVVSSCLCFKKKIAEKIVSNPLAIRRMPTNRTLSPLDHDYFVFYQNLLERPVGVTFLIIYPDDKSVYKTGLAGVKMIEKFRTNDQILDESLVLHNDQPTLLSVHLINK